MKNSIFLLIFCFLLFPAVIFTQQNDPPKYALVIGNGAYTNLSRLSNPPNDANDVADTLRSLGFSVDRLINGSLDQMENAIIQFRNRLSTSNDSYGFFFYAGHGVQADGENYLIPVDVNIPSDAFLKSRSVSVQVVLKELNNTNNYLNVVVLDACRDNPFGWSRSGSRGLALITGQPADSIIVYATSAGSVADDGRGRNGLFTQHFLNNLKTPGLEVNEVFRRTGADVSEASGRTQVPAIYNQFFGTAFLAGRPVVQPPSVFEIGTGNVSTGSLEIHTIAAGTLRITGNNHDQTLEMPAYGSLPIEKINSGSYRFVMSYEDGKTEVKTIEVGRDQSVKLEFSYRPRVRPERVPRESIPRESIPKEPKEKTQRSDNLRFNSLGVSIGSTFAAPMYVGGLSGTFSLWDKTFFELGLDIGFGTEKPEVEHSSVLPYVRFSVFSPFADSGVLWYAGLGVGYSDSTFNFPDIGEYNEGIFAADFSVGLVLKSGLNFSYTLRTDFLSGSHKLAFGYLYRFGQGGNK